MNMREIINVVLSETDLHKMFGLPDDHMDKAARSLGAFMRDPKPTHQMYEKDDVVIYKGEVCDVIGVEPDDKDNILELVSRKYKTPFKAYASDCEPAPVGDW